MIARLQILIDGEWGTLNTRECSNSEEEITKTLTELNRLQMAWATNYQRFIGGQFRVTQEKGR
jgi:hypothetical protein